MLNTQTNALVRDLIALDESTTIFLETMRGNRLQVVILSQEELLLDGRWVIRRIVNLFFDDPATPILYCISHLIRDQLTVEEYKFLVEDIMPIGLIFHTLNDADPIHKKNISITQETDPELAVFLNVRDENVFRKKYDYWVGDREIGYICEFFNEESLHRI